MDYWHTYGPSAFRFVTVDLGSWGYDLGHEDILGGSIAWWSSVALCVGFVLIAYLYSFV